MDHEEIYRRTIVDDVTGVYNERYLLEALELALWRVRRHGREVSLLMLDIDHSDEISERQDQGEGELAKGLARFVAARMRDGETLCRVHRTSFCIIKYDARIQKTATLAEYLRGEIAGEFVLDQRRRQGVTVSVGAIQLTKEDEGVAAVLDRVGTQLRTAQAAGGNRVSVSTTIQH